MAGRTRKSSFELISGGKSNRSKDDLKARAKSEIKLGDKKIPPTDFVKSDKVALKMWNHIVKINQENDYITSADTGIIEQYCLEYSEYQYLVKSRTDFKKDNDKKRGKAKLKSYQVVIELLKIDKSINNKNDLLLKLGTKLMLDPVSRISAKPLPKSDEKKSRVSKFGIG